MLGQFRALAPAAGTPNMCGRIAVYSSERRLVERFGLPLTAVAGGPRQPCYNLHPVDDPSDPADGLLSVVEHDERPVADRRLTGARWGPMVKFKAGWKRVINAKAETVATSPLWRPAWTTSRRVIVPADGYYEWQGTAAPKQPHFIQRRDRQMLGLAALIGRAPTRPDGERLTTCVIITRPATVGLRDLHHRMPVELSQDQFADWLNPDAEFDPDVLTAGDPSEEWQWWAVSPAVNNPRYDSRELIDPI